MAQPAGEAAGEGPRALGLSEGVQACLFDLDGVLTSTAKVHSAAWKEMFDQFLQGWSQRKGRQFEPFTDEDYNDYVDGRPRLDGTRAFLAARGIDLPEGRPDDPIDAETVHGLSNRKNELVLKRIAEDGVTAYAGSIQYVHQARAAGLRTAVVSSSANTQDVLRAAGIEDLFDVRIDGKVATERKLAGKPAPDTFLAAARELGLGPDEAAIFEDALSGVEAGKAGGFRDVVGVDRVGHGHADGLRQHGATQVVNDLAELLEGSQS